MTGTEKNSRGILVVDDEVFFRGLLSDMLKQNGFNVIADATNGEEAVAKFREFSPALVMMDVYMPVMGGIEATREIISLDPSAKILICSGTGFDQDIDAALSAGAKGVVYKPFYDDEVLESVRKALAD
ncbi:MAG TPA: response regulator [Geobacteraceae bacterium]|nr:response regulator [Geobacteraceae bacterium]